MPGQSEEPPFPPAPEAPPERAPVGGPVNKRPRSAAEMALPWLLGILVVLLLASSGGLVTAWIVASMKAAPPPAAAGPTPTLRPSPTVALTPTGEVTAAPTIQPLRTPTVAPSVTPEPAPFAYIVQRGDTMNEIADMFEVEVVDIMALNPEIVDANRIFRGQEILIPGYGIRPSQAP